MRAHSLSLSSFVFGAALLVAGCGDDTPAEVQKAEVDTSALQAGTDVVLSGNTGTVDVPLKSPIPASASESDLESDLEGAVALVVSSVETGASADLAAGTLVSSNPAAPGEYTWSMNEERDTITLEFYNQTPGGLTLKAGRDYDVQFAVTPNSYVMSVAAMSFTVTPSGG